MKSLKICVRFLLLIFVLLLAQTPARSQQNYASLSDYEIYSIGTPPVEKKAQAEKSIFTLTPRNSLNNDGLGGFFVSNTADKLKPGQMIFNSRYKFHKLTSRKGTSFYSTENGEVSTLEASVNWVGDWAEWAFTIPVHDWSLSAPRTYGTYSSSDTGLGNMRIGWKATYMPDKSYYRFAYGAMATITTGNPDRMLPAGSKNTDELKLFGCVTTKETDRATANLELGAIIDSETEDDRFLYRGAMSYEATEHVSLIGELVGEIQGGDDKDTLDLVLGMRLGINETWNLEFAYYKNLRTYREYGWDDQFQAGYSLRW
ncbi:MAG: hypothetical protein PWR01_2582 [Clostridiales bacterium]|jgi:hypothetical protein|nr:hypothetical protein [Clostridiales bacterium]MDN5281509.1 hypothetical protein [Candidatus Ozemobacter sp.]